MNKITSLSKKFKEFFNEKADKISITTRFIKRKRKLKGSSFVKAMVLGNIDPNYGLASKERHRNRGLFRLHGIGNQNRKNMN